MPGAGAHERERVLLHNAQPGRPGCPLPTALPPCPTCPPQALPALCRLELRCARCPSPEFIALSSLRSLTCLHLLGYAYVPESLSVLTWLRQLR